MIPSTHLSLLNALKETAMFDAAWNRFQGRYQDIIYRWCLRRDLQPVDGENVTQTVLVRLFQALPEHQHDPARPFRSWLKAVVENAVRDFYRDQRRHPADHGVGGSDFQKVLENVVNPKSLDDLADAVDGLTDPLLTAAMERVRKRVEEHTWKAFWAVVVDGRPAANVAAELGMSVGSVFKAKYRVACLLAEEYPA